jgi:hypothetical protein
MITVEVKNGSASRPTARGYGDLVWGGGGKDEDILSSNEIRQEAKASVIG